MAFQYHVLFLCTGNSARSIMAESILRHWGDKHFIAYSAGSHPRGEVDPNALKLLTHLGFGTSRLRSKSWSEFDQPDAPPLDFVFTVCDRAAKEICPAWPGQPMTAHWGVADPVAIEGSQVERMQAFRRAFNELERRIKIFVSLPIGKLDKLSLQNELEAIGQS